MNQQLHRHRSDGWLGLTVFGMVLFGVVMIYSASAVQGHINFGDDQYFVKKQIISAVLGFIGLLVVAAIDYHLWKRFAGWMLGATLLLLFSVLLFSGDAINGAHRWIQIGSFSFQPSELAKLTFIMYVSAWLTARREQVRDILGTFLPYLAVLLVISLLMLREPDFGTLMVIVVPALAIYYVAGLTWQQTMIMIVAAGLGISLSLVSPYRRERLQTFLHPGSDPKGASYQVKNIEIAIGSGGWKGLGFGQSKQKLLFLPEPHTDSIFAVISEELGSVRSVLLIALFCFIFYRGMRIATLAPDFFGRLLAVGITCWFGFQALINLGSMLQLIPLVGVPLPFISYGGTNLIISLLAVGMLLNISQQTQEPSHGR